MYSWFQNLKIEDEGPVSGSHAMRGYRDEFRKTLSAGDIVTSLP
jgi:hypothetical protein